MSAQEFGSPGEHMASQSNNFVNGGNAYRNPNDPRSPTQIYIDRGLEYSNETGKWLKANETDNYYNYKNYAKKYNDYYIKYNQDLFNQAMEYDKYMSNTAIQRQMEDLKKAGINPILAGRLGGAAYKGVNAPYVSINPGSTLSAISNFYQTEKNEQIQKEKMTQEERLADKKISAELYKAKLDSQTLLQIAKENNLTKEQIAELEENYKIQIQEMWDKVMLEINKNDITSNEEINKNNRIANIISSGIRGIGYAIGAMVIKSKFDGGKGSPGGTASMSFGNLAKKLKINRNDDVTNIGNRMWDLSQLGLIGGAMTGTMLVPIF